MAVARRARTTQRQTEGEPAARLLVFTGLVSLAAQLRQGKNWARVDRAAVVWDAASQVTRRAARLLPAGRS